MPATHEIRADFDAQTIVVWQAHAPAIADAALAAGRFVAPFSFQRMTWIKPSFLWLMERSNWGRKPGQERTLAVRMLRSGWDEALACGTLTHPEPALHGSRAAWRRQFEAAQVHLQWDPERSWRGAALNHYAIQVGLSRHVIQRYAREWIVDIEDWTPVVRKLRDGLAQGESDRTRRLLPPERVYPVSPEARRRLGMSAEDRRVRRR